MDRRFYLQPGAMIFNTLLDMMELQKGIELYCDPLLGKLCFKTLLYKVEWEIRTSVIDIDSSRCAVDIEVGSQDESEEAKSFCETMIEREYALLDSMLLIDKINEIRLCE